MVGDHYAWGRKRRWFFTLAVVNFMWVGTSFNSPSENDHDPMTQLSQSYPEWTELRRDEKAWTVTLTVGEGNLPQVWLGAFSSDITVVSELLDVASMLLEAAFCESGSIGTSIWSEEEACQNLQQRGVEDITRKWMARLITTRRLMIVVMFGLDPDKDSDCFSPAFPNMLSQRNASSLAVWHNPNHNIVLVPSSYHEQDSRGGKIARTILGDPDAAVSSCVADNGSKDASTLVLDLLSDNDHGKGSTNKDDFGKWSRVPSLVALDIVQPYVSISAVHNLQWDDFATAKSVRVPLPSKNSTAVDVHWSVNGIISGVRTLLVYSKSGYLSCDLDLLKRDDSVVVSRSQTAQKPTQNHSQRFTDTFDLSTFLSGDRVTLYTMAQVDGSDRWWCSIPVNLEIANPHTPFIDSTEQNDDLWLPYGEAHYYEYDTSLTSSRLIYVLLLVVALVAFVAVRFEFWKLMSERNNMNCHYFHKSESGFTSGLSESYHEMQMGMMSTSTSSTSSSSFTNGYRDPYYNLDEDSDSDKSD